MLTQYTHITYISVISPRLLVISTSWLVCCWTPWLQSRVKVVAILCFWVHLGEAFRGGRSDCGCAYEICSDLLNRFRGFCGSNPCISVGFLDDHRSARFKSYQFLKVVSGGRAPGKSSSFASSQLLVIERFHCFRAVRLEKVQFLVSRWFLKLIFVHSFKGANAGCCLLAAACLLLLACCCLPDACCCCCLPAASATFN